jgi:hypothetical protein
MTTPNSTSFDLSHLNDDEFELESNLSEIFRFEAAEWSSFDVDGLEIEQAEPIASWEEE